MPELPDIELYLERLRPRIEGQPLEAARIASPFLLRTAVPPHGAAVGKKVVSLERLGKRVVWGFEAAPGASASGPATLFYVFHLMILGRLRWRERGAAVPARRGLAAFDFPTGTVLLTEEGTKKRASLHVVEGREALLAHDPGGIDPLGCTRDAFVEALTAERHTLKRTLTDPRVFSGIGNAYSDELLHRARLSPMQMTTNLQPDELTRLFEATRSTLRDWLERLRAGTPPDEFPEKVTAFREGMAVHGRHGQPCPVCGAEVQRIVRGDHETNYCPTCQTGGRILADRALSRLLKDDFPRTLDELEALRKERPARAPEPAAAKKPAARRKKR